MCFEPAVAYRPPESDSFEQRNALFIARFCVKVAGAAARN